MLTQKGTQRIEVIVRKEGGTIQGANQKDSDNVSEGGGEKSSNGFLTALTGSSSKRRQMRVLKTNITHLFAASKQIALQYANYQIAGIGYKTGDQAQQDITQRYVEKLTDIGGMASSVAIGAVYGSWGGPLGIAVGIATAVATSSVSLLSKYAGRQRDYDFKVFKEENAIEYTRARAGINLTTGRLR